MYINNGFSDKDCGVNAERPKAEIASEYDKNKTEKAKNEVVGYISKSGFCQEVEDETNNKYTDGVWTTIEYWDQDWRAKKKN